MFIIICYLIILCMCIVIVCCFIELLYKFIPKRWKLDQRLDQINARSWHIAHYEYTALAKQTSVSREAMLLSFEQRCFCGISNTNVPRRVCRHLLKPCSKSVFRLSIPNVLSNNFRELDQRLDQNKMRALSRESGRIGASTGGCAARVWYRCPWTSTPSARVFAQQFSGRNCSPAPDSALWKRSLPRAFFTGGVFMYGFYSYFNNLLVNKSQQYLLCVWNMQSFVCFK